MVSDIKIFLIMRDDRVRFTTLFLAFTACLKKENDLTEHVLV